MKLSLLLLAPFLLASSAQAQSTLTEKLRQSEAGQGTVILNHSADIEQAVNNMLPLHPKKVETTSHKPAEVPHPTEKQEKRTPQNYVARTRHKAKGFRICIYTGGNSKADKTKAIQMGQICKKKFPELSTYTTFRSPRWVTHVGDFSSRHEAQKYVDLIRRARFTYEARIISSEVNLPH